MVNDVEAPRRAPRPKRARRAAGKAAQLLAVLLIVSFGTFMLSALLPGDPAVAILGEGHPPEAYEQVRQELGLNDPLLSRYVEWLSAVIRGDFGTSLIPPQSEVSSRLASAFPVSLQLAVMALILALVISIPLAMVSAYRAGGVVDRIVSAITFGILSVPSFVAGLLLIAIAVNQFELFPRAHWVRLTDSVPDNLYHAFLPVLTIALLEIPTFTRLLRSDLVNTLQEDFVLASRAKGMPSWRIMLFDAFRPSSYSIITVVGLALASLIGSTVIVETLFSLPGMGSLVVHAAGQGDLPIVQGAVLVIAVTYVVINTAVDAAYSIVDPRIRRAQN
ncbi:ABC transporter permease [Acrocarpospora macrocephala]|uniref:ABC transporter permease n=1 Tax=Acrocarpospora macrocephala TaxID=150177 RepID=A0A5M3WP60_9ACTN|nr:ABC transporter permease [Acrocarpospora macrocephala]GES09011.1 ABC transporter permease [Acrocarpospora macrocephala]